ncbi:MAG: hypothetical protein ACO1RX_10840 [Candidatus Sericytochromatia bacterium]
MRKLCLFLLLSGAMVACTGTPPLMLRPLTEFTVQTVVNHPDPASIATVTGMQVQSCQEEPQLLSKRGDAVQLSIHNASNTVITLAWLDYTGRQVVEHELQPNERVSESTFVNHPWLVRNAAAQCQGIYTPTQSGPVSLTVNRVSDVTTTVSRPDPDAMATRVGEGLACLRQKNRTREIQSVQQFLRLYELNRDGLSPAVAAEGFLRPSFNTLREAEC